MDKSVEKYKQRRDARIKKRLDEFNESDHPRDENGRFSSGGGGKSGAKSGSKGVDTKKAEELISIMKKNPHRAGANAAFKKAADGYYDLLDGADPDGRKILNDLLKKNGLQ